MDRASAPAFGDSRPFRPVSDLIGATGRVADPTTGTLYDPTGALADRLARRDLVILDEPGYLRFAQTGGRGYFTSSVGSWIGLSKSSLREPSIVLYVCLRGSRDSQQESRTIQSPGLSGRS